MSNEDFVYNANADYKRQKEDFVSDLTGGSVGEVNAILSVAVVSVALWSVLQSRQSFFQSYGPLAFTLDYLLNVVALLLAVTLYGNQVFLLCLLLAAPIVFVYVLPRHNVTGKRKTKIPLNVEFKKGSKQLDPIPLKPFLTTYRATMLISTCIAILAVDYRLFPRRFAKVETWGTSFMDMGVGSFVFTGGLVGARPVLKERAAGRSIPVPRRILASLRHSIPLFLLGVIRFLSVKGLDYAEHVTEYGVHWNFFFTLGLLPPFVAAAQGALALVPSYAALTMLIGGTYQVLLETTSLKAYILTAPRVDVVSMNREGIFSFLGYLAIFLAGQDFGTLVLPRKVNSRSTSPAGVQRNAFLLTLGVWAGIWWGLYTFSTSYRYGLGLTVSRRLANLPYVLWVAAFNSSTVLGLAIIDSIFFPDFYNATDPKTEKEAYLFATSRVMRAYNRNGLALFLAGNLLTGLVNLTTNTLLATPLETMIVLITYTGILTGLAVMLDAYGISIKL